MSLKYKFDKLNEGNADKEQEGEMQKASKDIEHYETPVNVRSLDLVASNGNHFSFNYAYLMTGEYAPETNEIRLFFNTHTIVITGRNLESLFNDVMVHQVKRIFVENERYGKIKNEVALDVRGIHIKQNL